MTTNAMFQKPVFQVLLFILFGSFTATAQQYCDCMHKYRKGTKYEIVQYDKNGKVIPSAPSQNTEMEVVDKIPTKDGWELQFGKFFTDNTGKTSKYVILRSYCKNGAYLVPLKPNIVVSANSQSEHVEPEFLGEMARYERMEIGKNQADVSFNMNVNLFGVKFAASSAKVFNRKVVGFETVTTPAGTFPCYKITRDWEVKKLGLFTQKGTAVEYWSKDYGVVKQLMYNRKGKFKSHVELAKFKE